MAPSNTERALPVLAIWAAIGLAYWIDSQKKKKHHLPPGPKKLPIIGNVMDLPAKIEWETYARWGKEYNSDIIQVSAVGTSIVILNSANAANDLLLKRSAIYSSRPHSTMHHELSGWGFTWALMPYGESWRAGRRSFTKHFNSSNPGINQPRELRYVKRFLKQLYEKPNDVLDHVRNLVGSTTLSMTYGLETEPYNDPYVELVEKAVLAASEIMTSGAFLVDIIPAMKHIPPWVPGTIFHQKAALMRGHAYYVREQPFKVAQEMIKTGDYEPSFVSDALRDLENSETPEEDLEHLKDVAGQVYIAGADTTASALGTFFLAMVCFPEVQKKAQQELDSVLNGRLPEHADFPSFPYLNAVIKEVYRWRPVTPMGVPHQTIADDVYRDYHIPKGSIVFANQWAMSNDENDYPQPGEFRPERYLTEDGKPNKAVRDPFDIAFGFGRRICAGRYLAHSTITLAAASVLSLFDLLKAVDENGKEIEPTREYHQAMISRPLEFPCRIKPRNKEAEEVIRACPLTFTKPTSA
uniref:Cytochrome P450 monooxygenase ple1 n=1 Tax=Rhodocybe pseudopiperita TaxID=693819 RepID=PLE1_RHOPP|nr:RecName: Full=Cytochrome P450 monooxygenase ple1; AltName: Full=Pleuromutilin biosynthesis cluster protein 1 [Rhodocybe pseudopiperita]BCI98769.1 putative cytochrome P450 [Rhodocybe pseudopiperita]